MPRRHAGTPTLFDPSPSPGIARVALPVPIDSLFDYTVAPDLDAAARVGCRVLVPFSGRRLTGVVVDRTTEASNEAGVPTRLAAIERIVDPEPVLSPAMIAMLMEAAHDVLCPPGIALDTALPAGSAPRIVSQLRLTARGRAALDAEITRGAAREVLEALANGPRSLQALARVTREAGAAARELEHDGLVERATAEVGPSARHATVRVARVAEGVDVDEACSGPLARAPRQAELLRRIAASGELRSEELRAISERAVAHLRTLRERGFVVVEEREAARDVLGPLDETDRPVELTAEQSAALDPICGAIRARQPQTFLLHGVTGSGKTEVYLRALAEAFAVGRQALVLVPEITLTHQIVARLRARFGDELAVLHSGLRPGERLEQWERLRRGATPIAVGARSALFAPLENVGVIVIDEEHDSAYKNEEGFRYHARDLAMRLARSAGCPLVLGSATPALETRYAAERGDIERVVLSRRIGGRPLPAIEVVDLAKERAKAPRGRKLILTRPLRRALGETLSEGGQSILFLNRRGFSTQVFCFDCGHAERCKSCDVALVYHAGERCLRCHYCDFSKPPPDLCSGCGAPDSALLGVGTERLEEEVRAVLPDARIARLDRDTARRRGYTESVIRALRDRQLDVLIGTQMVAKGHDFPGVRLVGVVAADLGLHMPDFRASERTFQLLTQVAGRAGRAAAPGRVVLQTFVPDHYALRPVRTHDYETFYAEELEHRRALGYPPTARLTQVMVSAVEESTASQAAAKLAREACLARDARAGRRAGPSGAGHLEVLGPAPAAIARLRGRYRFQLLIKGRDAQAMAAVSRDVWEKATRMPRDVQVAVDVDPVSML